MNPLLTLILCTLVVVMPISNCRIIHQKNDANLIEKTCKQTPYYDLCVHYLKADPRSSNANVTGLAQTMVGIMQTKSDDAMWGIHILLRKGAPEKEALDSCYFRYTAILEADVPQTIAALQKGYPELAQSGATCAGLEVTTCESYFTGKSSPITDYNIHAREAAILASYIIGQLHK